jgi:hypothetical protein
MDAHGGQFASNARTQSVGRAGQGRAATLNTPFSVRASRIHKKTMLHIQGNTHHSQGNDRKESLVIILGTWY